MILCPNCKEPFEPKQYKRSGKIHYTIACNRSCAGALRKHSVQTKQNLSNKMAAKAKVELWGALLSPESKKNLTPRKQGQHFTIICLECKNPFSVFPSQKKKRKYCSSICAAKNRYHPNSIKVHRHMHNGYQMDSTAELILAQTFDTHQIRWVKNDHSWKKWFPFIYRGKQGKYYPDFYLPEYDIWVEVKGKRYIRDGDDIRRAAVDRPVLLFMANEFNTKMPDYLALIRTYPQIE